MLGIFRIIGCFDVHVQLSMVQLQTVNW